ncbi:MAG: hypothetical protein ACRDHL_14585 [Candidatus Promineifilaceae bacterium]
MGVALLTAAWLLAGLACAFTADGEGPFGGNDEPTPVPGDMLSFSTPLYSASLSPGERVPGTQMVYVGRDGNVYNVSLDGLAAAKRAGDSFAWKGVIAPGVIGNYNLRISPTFISDDILVGGPVEITIFNPIPVELDPSIPLEGPIRFDNLPVEFSVPAGGRVPGATLTYVGQADQGAQLGGTSGYPYRALGDSLIWAGRLRGDVSVRYSLRVATLSEDRLRLVGTAEVWVTPAG